MIYSENISHGEYYIKLYEMGLLFNFKLVSIHITLH
jgi:hypothetical protein